MPKGLRLITWVWIMVVVTLAWPRISEMERKSVVRGPQYSGPPLT